MNVTAVVDMTDYYVWYEDEPVRSPTQPPGRPNIQKPRDSL